MPTASDVSLQSQQTYKKSESKFGNGIYRPVMQQAPAYK
jgi:hypothetical protein